jgi:ribonuclease D
MGRPQSHNKVAMTTGDTPIRDPASLESRLQSWPAGGALALDTEFVRERTYYPKLCLIQAAIAEDIVLVDALAMPEGGALAREMISAGRPKLLHAARQDIEALLPLTGAPLAPVFDTQQAAALLGFPAQVGYADLVRQILGVELEKGHARTDWARRPLSREQLAYAADDVRYLPALAAELDSRLAAAGRRAWLDEESAALREIGLYRVDPDDAWQRLRGLERLDAGAFAAARALAAWRERRAASRDLPRGWVLPDAAIHELAQLRPSTRDALARIQSVPAGTAARAADALLAAIAAPASSVEPRDVRDVGRPGPEQLRLQKVLQKELAAIAASLGVQPEVLAPRRDLAALARGDHEVPALRGWRKYVVGEKLLAVL